VNKISKTLVSLTQKDGWRRINFLNLTLIFLSLLVKEAALESILPTFK